MVRRTMWVAVLLVTGLAGTAAADGLQDKKLIQYGWGPPTTWYVATPDTLLDRPFQHDSSEGFSSGNSAF